MNNLGTLIDVVNALDAAPAEQARQQRANGATAANNRGVEFSNKGEWAKAVTAYQTALNSDPTDPNIRRNLNRAQAGVENGKGIACERNGDYASAVACFKKAVGFDPGNQYLLNNLANAQAKLRSQRAEEEKQRQDNSAAANMRQAINNFAHTPEKTPSTPDGLDFTGGKSGNSPSSGSNGGDLDFISNTSSPGTAEPASTLEFGAPKMAGFPSAPSGSPQGGYGIPGLPGIYTGGPGPGPGKASQNESKLQTRAEDNPAADHDGNPNLPGLALNNGKQGGYGIPGLPGVYTGGPGSGSGMTSPGEPGLKTKIATSGTPPLAVASNTSDPRSTETNTTSPQHTSVTTQPASALPASPAQGPVEQGNSPPVPGLSPIPPPPTVVQASAALQQQAIVSQAAAAAPVLEDASSKARSGFDTSSGPMATQPAMAIPSGRSPAPRRGEDVRIDHGTTNGSEVMGAANNENIREVPNDTHRTQRAVLEDLKSNDPLPPGYPPRKQGEPSLLSVLKAGAHLPSDWLKVFHDGSLKEWATQEIMELQPLEGTGNSFSGSMEPGKGTPIDLKVMSKGISGGPNSLLINPEIFNLLPDNERLNLVPFELGKVLYNRMPKDPAEPRSFIQFMDQHGDIIKKMYNEKHLGKNVPDLTNDPIYQYPNELGILCRAELLNLWPKNDAGKMARRDFLTMIKPYMKAKP